MRRNLVLLAGAFVLLVFGAMGCADYDNIVGTEAYVLNPTVDSPVEEIQASTALFVPAVGLRPMEEPETIDHRIGEPCGQCDRGTFVEGHDGIAVCRDGDGSGPRISAYSDRDVGDPCGICGRWQWTCDEQGILNCTAPSMPEGFVCLQGDTPAEDLLVQRQEFSRAEAALLYEQVPRSPYTDGRHDPDDWPLRYTTITQAMELLNRLSWRYGREQCFSIDGCTLNMDAEGGPHMRCSPDAVLSWDTGACQGFRFPTVTEWRRMILADHATLSEAYSSDDPVKYAWLRQNSGDLPHAGCQLLPNDADLCDVIGNLSEYVLIEDSQSGWGWAGCHYKSDRDGTNIDECLEPRAAGGQLVQRSASIYSGFRAVIPGRAFYPPEMLED